MLRITVFLFVSLLQLQLSAQTPVSRDSVLYEKAALLEAIIFEQFDNRLDLFSNSTYIPKGHDDSVKARYAARLRDSLLRTVRPYYQELIDSFPDSRLYYYAMGGRGYTDYKLGDTAAARAAFLVVLNSKGNNKDQTRAALHYLEYKRNIAKLMVLIALNAGQYRDALKYLDLVQKYTKGRYCGLTVMEEGVFMTRQYARCYLGLKDYTRAQRLLLPELLERSMGSDKELIDMACTALLQSYTREALQGELDHAFQHLKKKTFKDKYDTHYEYTIKFLNTRILLDPWRLYSIRTQAQADTIIEKIYKGHFYKLLHD